MKLTIRRLSPWLAAAVAISAAGCSDSAVFSGDESPNTGEDGGTGNGPGAEGPSGPNAPSASGPEGNGPTPAGPGTSDPDRCISNREFLATRVWPQVLGSNCLSCHGPGGIAANQGAAFTLQPSAYPGFLDVNLEMVRQMARTKQDDQSVLLRKPLGEFAHGGAKVLAEDSEAYTLLEEMVTRVTGPEECPDEAHVATFDDVEMLDAAGTFRKAALALNKRLPMTSELSTLRSDGEEALRPMIQSLFTEDAFYERLVEIFNDQWLTDRYVGNANNLLRTEDFPNIETYYESLGDAQREEARRAVAREPLDLMAYIVRNDRPFTEIVTANYTVLNAYTAPIYNNEGMQFEEGYGAFQEGQIKVLVNGTLTTFPHAGILTSPMFLNRYPTSATNRNRHRARIVLRELLATDILRIADRPIDPTKAVSFANPTRDEPECSMCHVILDPIAGAFQKWDDNDYERYLPDREWHQEMYAPGYGDEKMTLADFAQAQAWLGQRIAADPRFPISVVQNMYKALIGEAPSEFPQDPSDGSFPAWQAQESTVRAITEAFVASDYNLKVAIEGIVMSPYFRASNTSASDETRRAELGNVGTGRLLTPELLDAKIDSVFASQWMEGDRAILTRDLRLLYGGIDSDSVTERLATPNGMMSAIMWRMSTEVACRNAALDFSRAADKRRLFREVELDTVPENELGEPIAANLELIKANLRQLYSRMLGESLRKDSVEEARVLDLFVKTWREGRAGLAAESIPRNLQWECQYRRAAGADEDLPQDQRIERDDNYVIRSWMAVLTYLLSDYRFLYD